MYNSLKNKYNDALNKIQKNQTKKSSIPNININLNESSHLSNIDNNTFNYSITLNKTERPVNNSEDKNYQKFNYLRFKNITKNTIIPRGNNSLSYKNFFHNSLLDLCPKDIFGVKNNNTKSMPKIDKKIKRLYFEKNNQRQKQKEICSLKKKKKCKIDIIFRNQIHNQCNLLQAYTSNSARTINKSPLPKKIATYSNEAKISSLHTKNTFSQKINLTNKNHHHKEFINKKIDINKGTVESEILHKSYINNIPYNNKEKENNNRIFKKKNNCNNKYQLIYSKTKRENSSKNLYNNKHKYKKNNNLDTNKIFLSSNAKKKKQNSKNKNK